MILTIRRNEEEMNVKITPVETEPEEYKLGIWVKSPLEIHMESLVFVQLQKHLYS